MNYPAYPTYKESGIAWLGKVPEHWEVKRLKNAANYRVSNVDKLSKNEELPVRLCNYTDVYYHDQITPEMDLMEATATEEEIHRFHLQVNDVVITKDSEDWSDIAIPAFIKETAHDLVCGYHLAIIRPVVNKLDGVFLFRVLQSSAVNQQFQLAASGVTRYGLPKSTIGESVLPLPPLSEQTAIADFLDRETGRIDALIAKKRRMIELLREKRSALISRTVTRGLPPDAAREFNLEPHTRFRDSGIEWLGEVPEGWTLQRLSYLALLKSGESITSEKIADGGVYPVYGGNGKRGYYSSYTHDGIFVLIGRQGALCGNINYGCGRFWASEHAVVVHPLKLFAVKWLGELLSAMNLNQYSVSAAQPGLSVAQIGALKIPVPPLPEQTAIATYLDRETANIDKLSGKIEQAIERLQEYRTALITAAVTGKIDVRYAAESRGTCRMAAEEGERYG